RRFLHPSLDIRIALTQGGMGVGHRIAVTMPVSPAVQIVPRIESSAVGLVERMMVEAVPHLDARQSAEAVQDLVAEFVLWRLEGMGQIDDGASGRRIINESLPLGQIAAGGDALRTS